MEKDKIKEHISMKTTLPALTKEAILAYLSEIKPHLEKDGIRKIGLFGSYAKGYASKDSDIDIVVLIDKKSFLDRLHSFKALAYLNDLKGQIAGKFHKPVDICDFYSEQKMQDDKIVKGAIYV